jgi:hypothetical protein
MSRASYLYSVRRRWKGAGVQVGSKATPIKQAHVSARVLGYPVVLVLLGEG